MRRRSVAILGGGIMGCSLAIMLARRGHRVVVFDENDRVLQGASRWNEGKIHLGYMYTADGSLDTARKVLGGGLAFLPLMESLLDTELGPLTTRQDDLFLCHATSVVGPDVMADRFNRISDLVNAHPDAGDHIARFGPVASRRLAPAELGRLTASSRIMAGFQVPERSVHTNAVADLLEAAVAAQPLVSLNTGRRVKRIEPVNGLASDDRWEVHTTRGREGPFDCVVNALWQGRLAIDAGVGLPLPADWSHRYRLALFLRTRTDVDVPSALVAVGPFGDMKNYNDRDFYLSWYPSGLQYESRELDPEWRMPEGDDFRRALVERTFAGLSELLKGAEALRPHAETIAVAGGWVYASASGSLADPHASIHTRRDFGLLHKGNYISVDTGKYSTAPWLAKTLCSAYFP